MNENWVYLDKFEYRDEAVAVLERIKQIRCRKSYKTVRIDHHTWREIEIKPTTQTTTHDTNNPSHASSY